MAGCRPVPKGESPPGVPMADRPGMPSPVAGCKGEGEGGKPGDIPGGPGGRPCTNNPGGKLGTCLGKPSGRAPSPSKWSPGSEGCSDMIWSAIPGA